MTITIDQLKLSEIRIGEIKSVEKVEKSDKLLKLVVDFGEKPAVPAVLPAASAISADAPSAALPVVEICPLPPERDIRQIISGIALYFPDYAALVGVKCAFVTNLQPRMIRGLESNGMILAAGGDGVPFTLLRAQMDVPPGSLIR